MAKKKLKTVTTVHEHLMHVPPSKKNPDGITTRRQHARRIYTSYTSDELKKIAKNYDIKNIKFPTKNNLDCSDGNKYDELIAIWTDYFNKIFPPTPPDAPLDPNVIKALIASESRFLLNPRNPKAIGIAQITKQTLKILQDPDGELGDFLLKDIRQKDLLDPEIAIPCAVRWIHQKKYLAAKKLGRAPTPEEIILEYKGLLKSTSEFHNSALANFRKNYATLNR